MIINIDKGKNDKEPLSNKRGISLSNNISKLLERIINNSTNSIMETIQRSSNRAKRKQSCSWTNIHHEDNNSK